MSSYLQLADYKNDYADVAAAKLFKEVLYQLGGLPISARPLSRFLAAR